MSRNHVICTTTFLKYDGRVISLINSLAESYPKDNIYIYNLSSVERVYCSTYPNVFYRRVSLFSLLKENRVLRNLQCLFYFFVVFLKMLFLRPISIQVHHEGIILAPLIYKIFFRSTILVYDDKELYHPRDLNIKPFLYKWELKTIILADLVIFTNEERARALRIILHENIKKWLILENYVFYSSEENLDIIYQKKISRIHNEGKKILLHQGALSPIRGIPNIKSIIKIVPDDWSVCFIGVRDEEFDYLKNSLTKEESMKIENIGFIPYYQLNSLWSQVDAAMMFYDACTFNNKYAAPNRLFLAANNALPIIGNIDNHTLCKFITSNNCGVLMGDTDTGSLFFNLYQTFKNNSLLLKNRFEYHSYTIDKIVRFYKECKLR